MFSTVSVPLDTAASGKANAHKEFNRDHAGEIESEPEPR